jgi:hypothetical protein
LGKKLPNLVSLFRQLEFDGVSGERDVQVRHADGDRGAGLGGLEKML